MYSQLSRDLIRPFSWNPVRWNCHHFGEKLNRTERAWCTFGESVASVSSCRCAISGTRLTSTVEKVTNAARPSGGTPKLAFARRNRVHAVCLDDARQWRGRDTSCWGLDRVKVEKVTNAGRPSGGTSKLAFVRSDRVHAVCLDDLCSGAVATRQCGDWIGSELKK
jgi:hypothetical protein